MHAVVVHADLLLLVSRRVATGSEGGEGPEDRRSPWEERRGAMADGHDRRVTEAEGNGLETQARAGRPCPATISGRDLVHLGRAGHRQALEKAAPGDERCGRGGPAHQHAPAGDACVADLAEVRTAGGLVVLGAHVGSLLVGWRGIADRTEPTLHDRIVGLNGVGTPVGLTARSWAETEPVLRTRRRRLAAIAAAVVVAVARVPGAHRLHRSARAGAAAALHGLGAPGDGRRRPRRGRRAPHTRRLLADPPLRLPERRTSARRHDRLGAQPGGGRDALGQHRRGRHPHAGRDRAAASTPSSPPTRTSPPTWSCWSPHRRAGRHSCRAGWSCGAGAGSEPVRARARPSTFRPPGVQAADTSRCLA